MLMLNVRLTYAHKRIANLLQLQQLLEIDRTGQDCKTEY